MPAKKGTFVGNLFRKIAFQASGGVLGTASGERPDIIAAGYDPTNGGVGSPPLIPVQQQQNGNLLQSLNSFLSGVGNAGNRGIKTSLSLTTILGIGGLIFLIYHLFFKRKSYAKNKRNRRGN